MRWLLRLYPRSWRARYGVELEALLDELPRTPSVAIDLLRGAVVAHINSIGGSRHMTVEPGPLGRHPTIAALGALLVTTPTLLFVGGSLLAYQLGLPGMVAWWEPISAAMTASRLADLALLGAPAVAVLLAVAPLVRVEFGAATGEWRAAVHLRPRPANLLVVLVAAALGAVLALHIAAEFLLEGS